MSAYSYGSMASFFKNPASVAGPICDRLRKSETGLTPKALVDASRDEKAPLHNEFEWDDTIAAEKFREQQASCIIRHLFIIKTDTEEVRKTRDRAFVSNGENNNVYVSLKDALTTEKWKNSLLESARLDAERFVAKYNRLNELVGVIDAMKGFLGEEAPKSSQ